MAVSGQAKEYDVPSSQNSLHISSTSMGWGWGETDFLVIKGIHLFLQFQIKGLLRVLIIIEHFNFLEIAFKPQFPWMAPTAWEV